MKCRGTVKTIFTLIGVNGPLKPIRSGCVLTVMSILICSIAVYATPDFIPTSSAYHAYLDSKILFAFELTSNEEIFVEVINLGESRRCLSIDQISMRTRDGKILKLDSFLYDGTKSKLEGNPRGCVRQRRRRKFELGYGFEFPHEVRKVVFLAVRQAFRLQPVSQAGYLEFVNNLDEINIGVSSEYLKMFKLRSLYGDNFYGSKVRYRRVNSSRTSERTRGPITLLSTFPRQTKQAKKKKKGGSLSILIKLDPNGEVIEAVTEKTLDFGLTERALYEVTYWWDFAPAFEVGKPVVSKHRAKVVYRVREAE